MSVNSKGINFIISFLFVVNQYSIAQTSKIWYQSIQIENNRGKIILDFDTTDIVHSEVWAGNTILIEKRLDIFGLGANSIERLIANNRYHVNYSNLEQDIKLEYHFLNKKKLFVKDRTIEEQLSLKIYVPESMSFKFAD